MNEGNQTQQVCTDTGKCQTASCMHGFSLISDRGGISTFKLIQGIIIVRVAYTQI